EAAAMGTSSSFTDVMARLRAGDEDAARQVFQRFVHRLVGLARVRLGRDLRRRVDPEDVVQSAYKSFFLRYEEGRVEVRDWGSSAPAPLPSEVVGAGCSQPRLIRVLSPATIRLVGPAENRAKDLQAIALVMTIHARVEKANCKS